MIERDCALAAYEQRPVHIMHSRRGSPSRRSRRAVAAGTPATAEVQPAPPLPDRRHRAHPRHQPQDEPAAAHRGRPAGAARGGCATARSPASRPTTHRTRGTRRRRRSRRRPSASRGSRRRSRRSTPFLVEPASSTLGLVLERMSAGPARVFGLPVPRIAVGERANLVLLDLEQRWTVRADGFRSRSTNSWLLGRTLTGAVVKTVADGTGGARRMRHAGYLALEDGTVVPGPLGRGDRRRRSARRSSRPR